MCKKFLPLFSILLVAASCSNNTNTPGGNKTDSSPGTVTIEKADSTSDWRSLTESWTASLNLKNAPIMKSFYADTVLYYGDKISGEDVVKRQQEYFSTNADYHQRIVEYLGEEQQPDGNWRVRITKEVKAGGKTANYPASLIYQKKNGIWKIVSESDDITDLKKGQPVEVHYAPETVTVEGLMEENTGFGKNTAGGDPKSDNKETYYVIWPSQPLDVIAKDKNASVHNVDRLQLHGDIKTITALLNKKVRITGTLTPASSPHDFTKVILDVKSLQEVK